MVKDLAEISVEDLHDDGAGVCRTGSTVFEENDDGDFGMIDGCKCCKPGVIAIFKLDCRA